MASQVRAIQQQNFAGAVIFLSGEAVSAGQAIVHRFAVVQVGATARWGNRMHIKVTTNYGLPRRFDRHLC